jgi:hypothetical protein
LAALGPGPSILNKIKVLFQKGDNKNRKINQNITGIK